MKFDLIKRNLFTLILIFTTSATLIAQCPTCEPDLTCSSPDGPTSCPEVLPDAISNEYYEEVVTFYLPNTFTDPDSGFDIILNEVTITNVTGIPFGMEFTLNAEDNTYVPADGENHGCATICGTPILSGIYEGQVSFSAEVNVLGIDLTINQSFPIILTVLEGEGANNSFAFDQISACGEIEVIFEALIDGAPQPTEWSWDFGNGNTSTEQFPEPQFYSESGEYVVGLTTQLYNYTLTEVVLDDLSSGWAGDIEELLEFLTDPDPFFTIEDSEGNPIFTSGSVENTTSNVWNDLNIILSDFPYTLNWYDQDEITENDFLGSYTITGALGVLNFDVNSGTEGSIDVELVEGDVFYNEETVLVFAIPEVNLVIDEEEDMASIDDVSITIYQWYLDGEPIDGENDSLIDMTAWGIYSCFVTSEFGCSAFTDTYASCPSFEVEYDSETDILSTPQTFVTYQWFYNGLPLEGEMNSELPSIGGGNYWVEITTDYGCSETSDIFTIVGISENETLPNVTIYPNPSKGDFIVGSNLNYNEIEISIQDLNGKEVYSETYPNTNSCSIRLKDELTTGVYLIHIRSGISHSTQRILIH